MDLVFSELLLFFSCYRGPKFSLLHKEIWCHTVLYYVLLVHVHSMLITLSPRVDAVRAILSLARKLLAAVISDADADVMQPIS